MQNRISMKKIIYLFLLPIIVFSQSMEVKYYENPIIKNPESLKGLTENQLLGKTPNQFSYTLIANNLATLYQNDYFLIDINNEEKEYLNTIINEYGDTIKLEGTIKHNLYKDKEKLYFTRLNDDKIFFELNNGEKKYQIIDKKPEWNWQIGNDTLTISGYTCKKAISNYMGNNYIAWFTEEIPISIGPISYYGLPGLILKVETKSTEVIAYSIKDKNKELVIDEPIFKDKIYTLSEMIEEESKRFSNYKTINSDNFKPGDKIIIKTD